jgi:hypothetical protein
MITYSLWKEEIYDIKNDPYINGTFSKFLLLVFLTPFMLIADIIGIPIELLYLVYKKIGEDKDVKD